MSLEHDPENHGSLEKAQQAAKGVKLKGVQIAISDPAELGKGIDGLDYRTREQLSAFGIIEPPPPPTPLQKALLEILQGKSPIAK